MDVCWSKCIVDLESSLISDQELLCFYIQAQKGKFKEK